MSTSMTHSRGRGRPRSAPEEVTAQLAIRLTKADREALQKLADDNSMPISRFIVSVLRQHLHDEDNA